MTKQLVLGLDVAPTLEIFLEPKTEAEIIALMAQAILDLMKKTRRHDADLSF